MKPLHHSPTPKENAIRYFLDHDPVFSDSWRSLNKSHSPESLKDSIRERLLGRAMVRAGVKMSAFNNHMSPPLINRIPL